MLRSIPATWDKTIVLSGSEIMNGSESTDINISLRFLDKGTYQIISLEDKTDKDNAFIRKTKEVRNSDRVVLKIRPGGGFVAELIKI